MTRPYQRRLDWLRRTVEMFQWRLHAFVLLENHDHLFVETPEANLSAGMHSYNSSYRGIKASGTFTLDSPRQIAILLEWEGRNG